MHVLHLLHGRHHVGVQVVHDPDRADEDQENHEDAVGQGQHIVGVVRPCGDVQEKDQVDAASQLR